MDEAEAVSAVPVPEEEEEDEEEDEEVGVGVDGGISYEDAAKYWEGVAPTVEGMLGGFGKISPIGKEDAHCASCYCYFFKLSF